MEEFEVTRHLIVELKALETTLGCKELDQVEDYANATLGKSVFATDKATWDVIPVGTDYDPVVGDRFVAGSGSRGLGVEPDRKPGRPQVRVFVRRCATTSTKTADGFALSQRASSTIPRWMMSCAIFSSSNLVRYPRRTARPRLSHPAPDLLPEPISRLRPQPPPVHQ